MLTASFELIGQSIVYVLNIHPVCNWLIMKICSLHPRSFNESLLTLSIACCWWRFEYCTSVCLDHIPKLSSILITLTLALHINSNHIRYYDMDATWSTGLAWSYFFHPDYLVIWGWGHGTVSITQTGSCAHHFVKLFPGGLAACMTATSVITSWLPWSFPVSCKHLPLPLILLYKLSTIVTNCHLANNVFVLIKCLSNNCMVLFCHMLILLKQWFFSNWAKTE